MIVDSSALAEQVVGDVIASAFDSAGQRCSALRILCLQEDVAERTLAMLKGAMAELEVGDPRKLSVDVGPVITAEARDAINDPHRGDARARLWRHANRRSAPAAERGTFVAPTLIEVEQGRRRRARGVRPGAACAALPARGARRADRRRSTPPATASPSACTPASTRRSRASSSASRPATSTSTATSSARPSACSRSAARGCPAPGRRPAARSISAALSPSRRRTRSTAWRARAPRTAASASSATGSRRRAQRRRPSAASA